MKYNAPIGAVTSNDPYVDGNPSLGIGGSAVPAAAIEHGMREIVYVITQAGLTPDQNTLTQLYTAISTLIAAGASPDASLTVKGKVELADGTEALGGTDTTRAVTSSALASVQSKTATACHIKLPGGIIIQAGKYTGTTFSPTITFPLAFPTAVCSLVVAADDTTVSQALVIDYTNLTTSNFKGNVYDPSPLASYGAPFSWIAVGY
jgi:hypothetical protein